MDVNGLTFLVAIVDAGNLSEAARRMQMSRANVSYHLIQLEKSIGLQLLRRTTRRMELTEIGLRLYQHGRRICDEVEEAHATASELGDTVHGRVRISVPSAFGQLVMAPWIIEFKQRYPDVMLHVLFSNRVDDLLRHEVDLAVRLLDEPPGDLVARELRTVQHFACVSAAHVGTHGKPKALRDLSNAKVITTNALGGKLTLYAAKGAVQQELVLEPTLVSENFLFIRQAMLAGVGIGLVPDYIVEKDLAEGTLVRVLTGWELSIYGGRLFLLRRQDRSPTRAMRTLIDFLLERNGAGQA